MENFYYAQLDSEGYCSGLSQLSGEVIAENLIRIEEYDLNLLGLRYDLENNVWTEERRPEPEKSAVSHDDEVRANFLQELIEKGVVLSAMFLWGGGLLGTIPQSVVEYINNNFKNIKAYYCGVIKEGECK